VGTYERNLAVATLPDRTTAVPFRLCRAVRLSAVCRFPRPNATRLLSATVRQLRTRCFTNNCCKMADDNETIVAVKYERLGDVRARGHNNMTAGELKDINSQSSRLPVVVLVLRLASNPESARAQRCRVVSCVSGLSSAIRTVPTELGVRWPHTTAATGRSRTVNHNNNVTVNCYYDFRLL